ncbi:MAG: hypothetical protein GY795_37160 [Desulfobacterales bacterium]|nr:hypothetical protein [Desulfobacterales bacterium]
METLQREKCGYQHDPTKVIFNCSSVPLSSIQKSILCKGLNLSLPPAKLEECDYFVPYELFYHSLKLLPVVNGSQNLVRTRVKDIALSSFHVYNSSQKPSVLTKSEQKALRELSKNENLIIQKSDKGNCVVLIDRADYVTKMEDILSDTSKFRRLTFNPGKEYNFIVNLEKKMRRFLYSLVKKNVLSEQTFAKIAPTGSSPGILYGLGKVHKAGCPLRPILSAIGTPSYHLAKFLVPLLSPLTKNRYTVKDSFAFAKEISSHQSDGLHMASLDVKSLFTNIPLDETVEICVNGLYNSVPAPDTKLSKQDFRSCLNFAVKDNFFIFDSKWYSQLDGVAMGSPLGPTLANAFLCFHEENWLDACPAEFKPVLYRRYVDDIFVLFKCSSHLQKFAEFMNAQHSNIEFTTESEADSVLSFLDVSVTNDGVCFKTSVYRKPMFSGVYSNFDSFMPVSYKFGLVYTLVGRLYNICSSYTQFHKEVVLLKSILARNGYCMSFIDSVLRKFLNRIYRSTLPVPVPSDRKTVFIVLPYCGVSSLQIRTRLVSLCKKHFPHSVSCKVVLRPSFRMSNLFPFKDRVPLLLRSGAIYSYTCSGCSSTYYGKSIRHVKTRFSEHMGISDLTGIPVSDPKHSAVFDHFVSCTNTRPNFDDFSILCRGSCDFVCKIKESILIKRDNPVLNRNVSSLPLEIF